MSHDQQTHFVRSIRTAFPGFFSDQRVLEIGSLNIDGGMPSDTNVRSLFRNCDYIGLDVAEGKDVDVVCQGQDYDAPDGSFDTVVCCEVMEHNPHWKETMENMIRLCRPGGLVVMTCASTGRPEHGTTRTSAKDSPLTVGLGWDYYRNLTAKDFTASIDLPSGLSVHRFYTNPASHDLYLFGFRSGDGAPPNAAAVGARLARHYRLNATRHMASRAKRRALIALVGEGRYNAGPVRFW